MKIDHFICGLYETNCYILRTDDSATDCLIVDTGLDSAPIIEFIQQNKLNPVAVILTHGHADHCAGLEAIHNNFPSLKVYIHKNDAQMLTNAQSNLSALAGCFFETKPADVMIDEPDLIELAKTTLKVIHTPGHTPGGICLYSEDDKLLFSGDTLFAESIGRTDFPGGSMEQLENSIKKKILTLPKDTTVYPGHGPFTSIEHEINHNQFIKIE